MEKNNVFVSDHHVIGDSLTHLRNKNTAIQSFRHHSDKICYLLFAEAIRDLELNQIKVETPITSTLSPKLADEVIVVPVLRSGIAMLFGAMQLLPKSKIGFVGMQRDEKTAVASEYYWKLPEIKKNSVIIVTDPMLATGGSLLHLIKSIVEKKPKEIRVVCVVSAPEGIEKIHKEFPNIKIFTASLDSHLNDKKYIVPGLGDYGDRYFGT